MSAPARKASVALHPTTQYAVDVADGRIVTGKPVLWACRQHLEDLEHGEKRSGIWFDEDAADRICGRFFPQVKFTKGERAGDPFELEPWQWFAIGCPFGWKRDSGFRRYREVYIYVASGNGKSPVGAGIGNYFTGWDGWYDDEGNWHAEQEAQVFNAATKLRQARIIHATAIKQVDESPYLSQHLYHLRDRIIHPSTGSFFEPLGRDSKTEDGWDPLCSIFDEVHAYASGAMLAVLQKATVKRRQPMIVLLTTGGHGGPGTFGYQRHEYYRRLTDPASKAKNDSVFAYIAELDPLVRCSPCKGSGALEDGAKCEKCEGAGKTGDDPYDERNWPKANPNIGVSVYVDGLRELAKNARLDKSAESEFFVKNLNIQKQSGQRAISLDVWDACPPMPSMEELRRRPCFAGLDLSSTRDLTALVFYFPICGPWTVAAVLPFFWVPEDSIEARKQSDGIDYQPWIEAGEIATIPGDFIEQEYIRRQNSKSMESLTVKGHGCDRKFGEGLLPVLKQDGCAVHRIAQSFANLCVPWQTLEKLVGKGQLAHGGNGVLRWNAGNVVLERDVDNLEKPSKSKSAEKIDGIAALLNAIYLANITPYEAPPQPLEHYVVPRDRTKGGKGSGKRAIFDAFGSQAK